MALSNVGSMQHNDTIKKQNMICKYVVSTNYIYIMLESA
jgi:hypothetical protein